MHHKDFTLDIKPHNILLDEEFCPKISDFGLSKLCTRKDSIVSMMEPRGTAGYIAPEVFSRNFGAVSHKSDIYSYGMMILEMVGGKKSIQMGVNVSSEYFPDWIYKHLELVDEHELEGLRSKAEIDTEKKMILVCLWCIQTKPSDRPSINKVIEMLEGSVEALPIPPKPLLSSPPRSTLPVPNSGTTSLSVPDSGTTASCDSGTVLGGCGGIEGMRFGSSISDLGMAGGEIETLLSLVHLTEVEDSFLPLLLVWKLDDSWLKELRLVGKIFSKKRIHARVAGVKGTSMNPFLLPAG
ncbi:hypothetical protein SLEP1_g33290 [Rubroshorea leprosula]|uniref:Protein kinase domain-containing protein n=1 Tax=Rubroshorea leprosula TaxID=152421 RepID=A0AAV5KGB8_9ROSI|nr:hypothetical protein SLEP1_g33290 [Rubroshorea leprosula]